MHSVPTRRVAWAELLAHPDVEERSKLAGRLGIMAFHGGLEAGTAEIAEAAAEASGASLYMVRQPAGLRWHVPSSAVSPEGSRALAAWLAHVDVAVALHGYGRIHQPRRVLLGGTNRDLAARLADHLRPRLPGLTIVTDLDDIPIELRGLHPANPVNLPSGGGVQVELSPSARDRGLAPEGPDAVAAALADLARSWPAAGAPPGTAPEARSTQCR